MRTFGYWNAGQDCTAACRVLAGPGIHDDLVAGLADAAKSLVVGDTTDEATELGPVVSAEQLERVAGFVDRAVAAGASAGHRRRQGRRAPGFFYEPTVIAGVQPGRRDRPARGVRPGRHRAALQRRGRGAGVGQRRRLRAGRLGVDQRRRPGDADGERHAVRHRVGQRPRPARVGDAPRRLQAVGRRQGHVGVRDRGLHRAEARDDQDLVADGVRRMKRAGRSRRHRPGHHRAAPGGRPPPLHPARPGGRAVRGGRAPACPAPDRQRRDAGRRRHRPAVARPAPHGHDRAAHARAT